MMNQYLKIYTFHLGIHFKCLHDPRFAITNSQISTQPQKYFDIHANYEHAFNIINNY